MTVIVCIDDRGGMMFGGRRQSMDAALRARVLQLVGDGVLRMNTYSKKQFTEDGNILCDEDFLQKATRGDFCFVEDAELCPFENNIKRIIVYKWNRKYPADRCFDVELSGWHLVSSGDFVGTSHEKITEEVYER